MLEQTEVLTNRIILQGLPSQLHKRRRLMLFQRRPISQLLSSVGTIAKSKNSLDSLEFKNFWPCSMNMASTTWSKFKACRTQNLYYQCETSQWLQQKKEMRKQASKPRPYDANSTRQSNGISTAPSLRNCKKSRMKSLCSSCKWLSSQGKFYQLKTIR